MIRGPHSAHIHSVTDGDTYPKLLISQKLVVCVHHFRAAGKEKGKAGKLQLDHNHRGHSGAISFPVQSHNPMAQTFALIRHLGNTSIPFHFISSNQSPILNEYTESRNLAGQDIITKGKSFITAFYDCLSFLYRKNPLYIYCRSCLRVNYIFESTHYGIS